MKKDYVVSRIEASQDGAPYVYVAHGGLHIFLILLLVANTEGSLYAVLWIRYYIGEINILGARAAS